MTAIVGFTVVIGRRPQPQTACPVVLRPGASGRAPVVCRQDTVVRPAQPWTPAVHTLMRHFEAVGCTGAPGCTARGSTATGMKSCHSSTVNPFTPYAWSDDGIHALGALLRQLHDAAESFSATDDMIWQPWFTRQTGPGTIIGHGDTGPWTVLSDADGIPIAFIDWEYAGPVERIDEVAQTA
jgi:hypothetical protein